ncbi:MAG: OmpA family protein [Bryobacterales bacterium]|nr:OmpA family protein [Bryobacterales bacterium]
MLLLRRRRRWMPAKSPADSEPHLTIVAAGDRLHSRPGHGPGLRQSEALVASLLQAVEDRQSTDVSITGHTDTTGTAPANVELGLRRAERVAEMLKQRGLAAEFLTVVSHGEGNLLVNTPDGVEEARNRRVEVTVR